MSISNNILVIGSNNNLGQKTITSLLEKKERVYYLKSLPNNYNESPLLTRLLINLALEETISQEYLSGIEQIIFCLEDNFNTPENFGNTSYTFRQLENLIDRASFLADNTTKILFNFRNPIPELANLWVSVNDVVMGGVSQSKIAISDREAVFSGYVSTENNGGFASVRTQNIEPPLDLSGYEGIELRVKGDGKRYKFITRCEDAWDGVSYCASFDTVYNIPVTIRIPFMELRPVVRAKTFSAAAAFDSSKVYSLQLMLSKFEYDGELNSTFTPGKFNLGVEYISAYGSQKKPQLITINPGKNDSLEKIITQSQVTHTFVRSSQISGVENGLVLKPENYDFTQFAIDILGQLSNEVTNSQV